MTEETTVSVKMSRTSLMIDDDLYAWLKRYSTDNKISLSAAIRKCVKNYKESGNV
jgi:predicted CopG family antitoxin